MAYDEFEFAWFRSLIVEPIREGRPWDLNTLYEALEKFLSDQERYAPLMRFITGRVHLLDEAGTLSRRLSRLFIEYSRQAATSYGQWNGVPLKPIVIQWAFELADAVFSNMEGRLAMKSWIRSHRGELDDTFVQGIKELENTIPSIVTGGGVGRCLQGLRELRSDITGIAGHRGADDPIALASQGDHFMRINEPENAIPPYTRGAILGHALCQYNLGVMSNYGIGMKQDFVEAARWYREAAEQGNDLAQHNLGMLYLEGKGVQLNLKEAEKWLRKAAESGNKRSQSALEKLRYSSFKL